MSKEKSQSKKTEEKAKTEAKPDAKTTKAKTTPAKEPEKFGTKPENTIFIGNKPAMTYVLAVLTCFNENKAKEVKICARGRAISSAVDVAELARNRFLPDVKVKSIVTSTEQVTRREGGGDANVSAIEIVLSK